MKPWKSKTKHRMVSTWRIIPGRFWVDRNHNFFLAIWKWPFGMGFTPGIGDLGSPCLGKPLIYKLGGGNSNNYFVFSPRSLGKISNWTNIFQMGWFNHQLAIQGFRSSKARRLRYRLRVWAQWPVRGADEKLKIWRFSPLKKKHKRRYVTLRHPSPIFSSKMEVHILFVVDLHDLTGRKKRQIVKNPETVKEHRDLNQHPNLGEDLFWGAQT